MPEYDVLLAPELESVVEELGARTTRVLREEVRDLGTDPIPERDYGNKQSLSVEGKAWYRNQVGRSWVLFYTVDEDAGEVRVVDIRPSDRADDRGLV